MIDKDNCVSKDKYVNKIFSLSMSIGFFIPILNMLIIEILLIFFLINNSSKFSNLFLFFEVNINAECKFISGPFSNTIFKIIEIQKNKIKILMGDLKTTIKKKEFLFKPI